MRLRALIPEDVPALAEALAAMDPWATLGFSAQALAAYLNRADPSLFRVVAERKGQVAGLAALRAPWLRGPYLELLAVLPQAQGQGAGRRLVEWALSKGEANLWACVSDFNAPARAFYARLGFVEVGPLPDLVMPGRAEILLRLAAAPALR